jgi:carboxypeptidase Q
MPRARSVLPGSPPAHRLAPALLLAFAALLAGPSASRADTVAAPDGEVIGRILDHALADTFAHTALRELTDEVGPRLAGSAGMRRAHAWAERWLRRAGADSVWAEPVTVPRWERGREWARLTHPYAAPLEMLGLGMSVGTPPEGLQAEVIAVRDWEELEARADAIAGKIVVFDPPWRSYGFNVDYRVNAAGRAAAHGAVAALIRPAGFGADIPHTGVMRYPDDGTPRIPAASLTPEGAALLHRLSDAGVRPRVRLMMEAEPLPDGPCANIVAEWRGRERPGEVVLIAGHLDAWDTGSGAHDDGAGCTIMVAALKVLADLDLRPRRTVRVVLYTSEEYGGQGGEQYRDRHREDLHRHVLALESDAGCFAPAGFSVRGSEEAIAFLDALAAPLAPVGADSVYAGWAGVDIRPLVEQGVPGVGHRVHGEDYFRYHHGPADVYEAIDPDHLAANVAAVAGFSYAVADSPRPVPRPQKDD